ncbi:MAG: MMPL family transporter, partial [Verrucomicrobiae bacterium]|nr:MMPL family transporter [Verrucomicrobiae bacterium]
FHFSLVVGFNWRALVYTMMACLPLGLGIVWTLGAMPILHLRFNPANIITLPLVIGAGVAYGVYTTDRFRETHSPAIFSTSTGKAVLLSAITTMFGFGSLILATHRGIASLGLLMTLGITMCMITALYVLPALLDFILRRSSTRGTEGGAPKREQPVSVP